ncbi:MAG: ThuA domain-containing protein [Sedimentisphaerales bacterium]|nr:ThuA domain-containing protein [Sedimentisphaerales bacterium]
MLRPISFVVLVCFCLGGMCSCRQAAPRLAPGEAAGGIKVVVVTGGHEFEHDPFFAVFDGFEDVAYVEAAQKDHSEIFEDIDDWPFDVIVLYNMTQNISPQRQENFRRLLDRGVGLLALHHSLAAYPDWDEYRNIIGGKYYTKTTQKDGQTIPMSEFQHDLDMTIHVEDTQHPITIGMSDFFLHDEAYSGYWYDQKGNHLILSTNTAENDQTIGWIRKYGKARVCYLQLGHDSQAYQNGNFRWLVRQAVRWCAKQLPETETIDTGQLLKLPGL